jgi:DNA primase
LLEDLSYINCRDLLESTGIKNISESGGEISFSCPSSDHFHGDTSPSARMNSRTSLWLCHSCGQRGTGITFLAWHKSIPETVARRLIEERYGGGRISAQVGNLEEEVKRIMNPEIIEEEKRIPPDESWIEKFHLDWRNRNWCQGCSGDPDCSNEELCCGCAQPPPYKQYIYDRGFDPDILNRWQIGYDKISDRITIPIRDNNGVLVGFKGRTWRDNTVPKYMILGEYGNQKRYGFQPYKKSHYVFGLDKYIESEVSWGTILVEGELNAIAMNEYGYLAVGIAGSEFSQIQADLIKKYSNNTPLVYLDNDKAGNKGTKKVIEMLSPYMSLKIVQNAPGDAADLDASTVKELINNCQPYLSLQVEGKS